MVNPSTARVVTMSATYGAGAASSALDWRTSLASRSRTG
jgi:hypothetical protein